VDGCRAGHPTGIIGAQQQFGLRSIRRAVKAQIDTISLSTKVVEQARKTVDTSQQKNLDQTKR